MNEWLRAVLVVLLLLALLGLPIWLTLRSAQDPARMAVRWIITIAILAFLILVVGRMVEEGAFVPAFPAVGLSGLILAVLWGRDIGGLLARPLTSAFTGGDTPPDPQPFYSIARALRNRGKLLEAIQEIRKQLELFPADAEGHMSLAEIQARDLKDLPGAENTLQHFCAQPGQTPQHVCAALYALADWHLSVAHDRDAAARVLQQLVTLYPDSEIALGASQRIAHLGSSEMMLPPSDRHQFVVAAAPPPVAPGQPAPIELRGDQTPARQAADWVAHLEKHPLDTEAREKLAVLYFEHYQRLDLAADQLEQMIAQPHQPQRQIVHWLNLLADLQVRAGADYDTIRATLERIVQAYPGLASAENARKRIELLRLELRSRQTTETVKLGTYEQNLGLKPGFRPPDHSR